jgi:hypothetical protein
MPVTWGTGRDERRLDRTPWLRFRGRCLLLYSLWRCQPPQVLPACGPLASVSSLGSPSTVALLPETFAN